MGFDEIVMIVKVCVLGGLSIIGAKVAWTEREKIAALVSATWRRFVTVSFEDVVNRIEDSRPDYVEPEEEVTPARPGTPYRSVPDTNQLEPASSGLARTGTVPTDEALIKLLAGLQKPSGAWALSANKIAVVIGGERESVLAIIREVRGITEPIKDGLRVKDSQGERLISRA